MFIAPLGSKALLMPQIYFTKLNVWKNNFQPGEQIKGTVSLRNYENFAINDLVFHFQILKKENNENLSQMIDEQISKNIFNLPANKEKIIDFVYSLPSNLPKGNFIFRIQLTNSRGEEMSWIDKIIKIGGNGKFLNLSNYWIVKSGEDLSPAGGVNYQLGEIPQIRFDITNKTKFTIIAFPKIITYKRNVGGEIAKVQEGRNILLEPNQKKTVQTRLAKLDEGGTYLSKIQLYLKDSQESVSNSIFIRWVIVGKNNAEILSVLADKNSYQAGEKAKIKIQFTGPAYTEAEEENPNQGNLIIRLYDKNKKLIGEKTEKIGLKTGQLLVKIPIKENVDNPIIEAMITKNGKTLDEYSLQNNNFKKKKVSQKNGKINFLEKNKKSMISIFGIIAIIITIIYSGIMKKKGIVKILILLTLIGIGIFFAGKSVLAATEVTGGYCNTTIIFNSPRPNQVYRVGDVIHFSGAFRVTSCGDGLFFNKVTFFITENKNIPLKRINACSSCLGAVSTSYSDCNVRWCDQVRVLNESSGYKIYKLGEVYPPDVHQGARPYWVRYNKSFVIPSNLGFSGPVRFYVQYSGTHWHGHWHWNITYQKGYINNPPKASISCYSPVCSSTDCVGYTGCPFVLTNNSVDPDGQSDIQKSEWDILNFGISPDVTYSFSNALHNFNFIPQLSLLGNHRVRLTVKDRIGETDSAYKDFTILKGIIPDFKCSLDKATWWDCKNLHPYTKGIVYFLDQSKPSVGASHIVKREWQFENGSPVKSVGEGESSFTRFQSSGSKKVTLTVTDDKGRVNSESKIISVKNPHFRWREVPPSGPSSWLQKFLANISDVFSF